MKIKNCPICGSQGEDMIFAFYCFNIECQNFKKEVSDEDNEIISSVKDVDDHDPYSSYGYWPYRD